MARIFISYRRDDNPHFVGRIHENLKARRFTSVFMDTTSIPTGGLWLDCIKGEIDNCSVVVLIIGPRWLEIWDDMHAPGAKPIVPGSKHVDYIEYEVDRALHHGKPVIPVLLADAEEPPLTHRPEDLHRQWARVDSDHRFERDMDDLHRTIRRLCRPSWFKVFRYAAAAILLISLGWFFASAPNDIKSIRSDMMRYLDRQDEPESRESVEPLLSGAARLTRLSWKMPVAGLVSSPDLHAVLQLGKALYLSGERGKAIEVLQWLKKRQPGNPQTYLVLGTTYKELGDKYLAEGVPRKTGPSKSDAIAYHEKAAEIYAEAIGIWRDSAKLHHYKGWSLYQAARASMELDKNPVAATHKCGQAIAAYDKALSLVKEYLKCRYNKLLAERLQARIDGGKSSPEGLQERLGEITERLHLLAGKIEERAMMATRDEDKARYHFTSAIAWARLAIWRL